jgi:hypothetical protein
LHACFTLLTGSSILPSSAKQDHNSLTDTITVKAKWKPGA